MQVKEKVFILKTTRYGDTDVIVNCLTSSGARLSLFARGAVKSKKRFGGGVLEPTHFVHVVYDDRTSRTSEQRLHTLKEATLIEHFAELRTDFDRLDLALYMLRLINDMVKEGDVHSGELFNLLGNSLRALGQTSHTERLRTHFEVKLLSNQGVLPIEREEQVLLNTPIADHAAIVFEDQVWTVLRSRVRAVLNEYLGQTRKAGRES
jgi:DNA repair protein RecO (recombination protein O)